MGLAIRPRLMQHRGRHARELQQVKLDRKNRRRVGCRAERLQGVPKRSELEIHRLWRFGHESV